MANGEVAVVGLGATGSFVARAAYDCGYKVTVYVHGNPNATPPGAFWLHWIPDDVSGVFSSKPIRIIGKGWEEVYTRRQWGKSWYKGLTSSFPREPVIEEGYNPAEVLPELVPDEVKIEIVPYPFSDRDVEDLARGFDFVFQTFPRKVDIEAQPERIPFVAAAKFATSDPDRNVVVYNGLDDDRNIVVREAMLFGNHFLEFPKHMLLPEVKKLYPLDGWHTVVLKDLAPNTLPVEQPGNKLFLMGRYAHWDRRCLSHDCYGRTVAILTGDGHNG